MNTDEKLYLAYKEALAQFREHPKLVWTRNSFFLITQTGLLAFIINANNLPIPGGRATTCIAGLFLAFVWLWVNLVGRRLHREWRKIVLQFENRIFDNHTEEDETADKGVVGPFELARRAGEGSRLSYSINSALILLASGFAVVWMVILYLLYLRYQ